MTSAEAIARIRELLAKATPGEWSIITSDNTVETKADVICSVISDRMEHDRNLITAAPTELARLCDLCEAQDKALTVADRALEFYGTKLASTGVTAREARAEISRVLSGEGK